MDLSSLLADLEALRDEMIRTRRDLHQHPELGFQERRTAGIIAARLSAAGLEVRTGVAHTGVLGVLRGGQPGPGLLLRADMDALPVQEENDLPFRSQTPGVMHACGHDTHVAVALAVAQTLARHRDALPGTITFAFQPAEEIISGARPMIEQGALDNPPVQATLAFHVTTELPVGQVSARAGAIMASADRFEIVVRGTGGHGAYPHRSVDPILVGSEIVVALQLLVSREVNPIDPAVVTIGMFHAGTAFNIIPPEARLAGTLRTLDQELRARLQQRIGELASGIAASLRAQAEVAFDVGCPPVVNDPAMAALVRRAALAVVGEAGTVEREPQMGADDMALFLEARPGCYFFVGGANPPYVPSGPHHSPQFGVDEASLPIAAEVLLRAAVEHQELGGAKRTG